jgi:hypothetical protein
MISNSNWNSDYLVKKWANNKDVTGEAIW